MILVDSSGWIEYFRRTGSSVHSRMASLLTERAELATTEPVAMELLAGAAGRRDQVHIKRTLAACRLITVDNGVDWDQAAAIHLACRRMGVTPRQLVDCLIAAVAIRAEVPILAQDRDYELIADHTPLELAT